MKEKRLDLDAALGIQDDDEPAPGGKIGHRPRTERWQTDLVQRKVIESLVRPPAASVQRKASSTSVDRSTTERLWAELWDINSGHVGEAVQRKESSALSEPSGAETLAIAAGGVAGGGTSLPHAATIKRAFGAEHAATIDSIQAHVGGAAATAADEIGAVAYATGNQIAFSAAPDLHTAAHEAAHVVQQAHGVRLKGGVGEAGDEYERHAEAVADRVVAGESAVDLLLGRGAATVAVQRKAARGGATNLPAPPQPAPGTNDRTYVADGAMCDGPAVGACMLDHGVRGRLVQVYMSMVEACRSAFHAGCAMAYTDVKLEPDAQLPWYVDLALTAGGYALADALGRALGHAADWARGAQPAAYARMFDGEWVSERKLEFYGAVARIPFRSLQPLVKSATQKGTKAVSAGLASSGGDKDAGQILINVCIDEGNEMFNIYATVTPAQVDDVKLFALTSMFEDSAAQNPNTYKDAIISRLGELKSYQIGKHVDPDMAGGRGWQRGAVWITDGKNARLGLVEHDDPTMLVTKGETAIPRSAARRKWIRWIDDETMAAAAEDLTRARGNGNILKIDRQTAEMMFEGFKW